MSTNNNKFSDLNDYFEKELINELRNADFDMNDESDEKFINPFSRLTECLKYINEKLLPAWKLADKRAISYQSRHRILAKTAIFTGTSAVFFAILQMSIERSIPSLVNFGLMLEIFAVIAGVVTVIIGVNAKRDKKWLCERNRAERLRMLKFKSLGWSLLWENSLDKWKQILDKKIEELKQQFNIEQIKEWAHDRVKSNNEYEINNLNESSFDATVLYYRYKRLKYQANYFEKRGSQLHKAAKPWRKLTMPIFIFSTVFVLIHFFSAWLKNYFIKPSETEYLEILESIDIWALAFAAIIPVIGLGSRIWLGAFEPHRSANLYKCKEYAINELTDKLENENKDFYSLERIIRQAEEIFENEHKEWLRLMLETEWML